MRARARSLLPLRLTPPPRRTTHTHTHPKNHTPKKTNPNTKQGMDAYCVRGFAEALDVVPYTLAENAGLDPIEIVTELRRMHAAGEEAEGE